MPLTKRFLNAGASHWLGFAAAVSMVLFVSFADHRSGTSVEPAVVVAGADPTELSALRARAEDVAAFEPGLRASR